MILKAMLLDEMRCLADKKWQETVWLGKVPGKMDSFTETECGIFDDTGLSDALEAGEAEAELGERVYSLIIDLDAALKEVRQELSDEQIIESQEMILVRRIATELVSLLDN